MKRLELELDELDYAAVQKAIARRQVFKRWGRPGPPLPDGKGNMAGRVIAEICRGWLDFIQIFEEPP